MELVSLMDCEHRWCPLCRLTEWFETLRRRRYLRKHPFKPVTMEEIERAIGATQEVMRRNLEESLFDKHGL
jgi:hypothetical protein